MSKESLKFLKSHEWVDYVGKNIIIGLSDYAVDELGEATFINLPEIGDEIVAGGAFGEVEGTVMTYDVYSPASGIVSNVNQNLLSHPEKLNDDPYSTWLVEIEEITECEEMMTYEEYKEMIEK